MPTNYQQRFFVPDFDFNHPFVQKKGSKKLPRFVFVAESPHVSEIEPESIDERRPLCGKAGKSWWKMLGWILENEKDENCSLERMLRLSHKGGFVVMNSIQYPIDENIVKHYGKAVDPVANLGFSKTLGPSFYKKKKESPEIKQALQNLSKRLKPYQNNPNIKIICLGLDSKWFVERALGRPADAVVPHPSAWWRRGGFFERKAETMLRSFFQA